MITAIQCKMARSALGWGVRDLAARSKVGVTTINRFETGQSAPVHSTLVVLRQTFEAVGVRFTDDGGIVPPKKSG
jgi:ribosome-binding protein aMBF1 (putative translation factor)